MNSASWKKHRFGYLYAFFALYMQFILPIGAAAAAHPSNNNNLLSQAIVCTSMGVRYIDLQTGKDITPRSDQVASRCPICLSIDQGTKLGPVPTADYQVTLNAIPVAFTAPILLAEGRDPGVVYLSRGPPLPVIPV